VEAVPGAGHKTEAGGRRRGGAAARRREVARELHLPPLAPPLAPRGIRARRGELPAPAAGTRHGYEGGTEACRFGKLGFLEQNLGLNGGGGCSYSSICIFFF
jgi:hypothetical protein